MSKLCYFFQSYKVNVVQSNEGLGKPTTSKIKIQPIFGNANVVDMTKKNGPFPVIYIGTPNIIDMQVLCICNRLFSIKFFYKIFYNYG